MDPKTDKNMAEYEMFHQATVRYVNFLKNERDAKPSFIHHFIHQVVHDIVSQVLTYEV